MNKIIISLLAPLALILHTSSYAADYVDPNVKQGCAKLSQYRKLGQKFYDQKNYKKALDQFQKQASWSDFCQSVGQEETGIQVSDNDIDIANNNVGLTYSKLNQPLWARAWFQIKPTKTSQFNLKKLAVPQANNDFTGEYVSYAGFGEWNRVNVKKRDQKYHIEFTGLWMGPRSLIYGPNIGEFETEMPLQAKKASYRYKNCRIAINFTYSPSLGNFIEVEQLTEQTDCGFGMNVSSTGYYQKVEPR
ncbi:hypothetical protein [Acinetobacter bereziniae]|jgi:hypothetical protein|uniref:hypothetical protein n=1 Tax=Acinetobacter bereziniae TaxID=106648 RepID=UPI0005730EE5|nr:hypothetical protein [Acinetobacter bereziniae]MBI0394896.1 hypothetical protein [Acinetobacter bereziniae]MCV2443900.1 hypothetical protein [Acinetobacter bereziniae]CEI52445.1 putative exported protein [Acinetobacter bereziniae]